MVMVTSCSKDEISLNDTLVGVWERMDSNLEFNSSSKLVFASDHSGLSVNSNTFDTGEMTSTVSEFKWEILGDEISVIKNDVNEDVYLLNSKGELVLKILQDKPFSKISDNTQNY